MKQLIHMKHYRPIKNLMLLLLTFISCRAIGQTQDISTPFNLSDTVVCISSNDRDNLMYNGFLLEREESLSELYKNSFLDAMKERDILIGIKSNLESQNILYMRQIEFHEQEMQLQWDVESKLRNDLTKAKRQKTFITIGGSIIVGALAALLIAK